VARRRILDHFAMLPRVCCFNVSVDALPEARRIVSFVTGISGLMNFPFSMHIKAVLPDRSQGLEEADPTPRLRHPSKSTLTQNYFASLSCRANVSAGSSSNHLPLGQFAKNPRSARKVVI
jgi:hypothetical protein